MVDRTNTSATTTVSSQLTERLPVARSYQAIIPFAPGVTDPASGRNDGGNPNSHGALKGNNIYLFDGVDTTDVTTGTFGQNSNFEAIQEVAISTTGISAEYGRAQGAVVNVITKSGTNKFAGSFKVYFTNDSWNAQNKGSNPINGASFARQKNDTTVPNYNYTLGGPIWPDHIWFFGTYETVKTTDAAIQTFVSSVHPDETGQSAVPHLNQRLWDGKLTFQLTPSHLLTGQFNSDPITGFITDYWNFAPGIGSAELQALTAQSQNACSGVGCLKQGSWSGVFGSKVTGEARYAEHRHGSAPLRECLHRPNQMVSLRHSCLPPSRRGGGPGVSYLGEAKCPLGSSSMSFDTASMSARWVNACGKLPRCRPDRGSISSA